MVLQLNFRSVTHRRYHVASVEHTAGSHLAKHSGTEAHSHVCYLNAAESTRA